MNSTLHDPEFGAITLRRTRLARYVRLTLDARGSIAITLPKRAPLFTARRLLDRSRDKLRTFLQHHRARLANYKTGDMIGASHRLRLEKHNGTEYIHRLDNNEVVVSLPVGADAQLAEAAIQQGIKKALRQQAEVYLPARLRWLGDCHGLSYRQLRLSSARTRWGSCSTQGTISLNIWLMQLPRELIDYVIIHELCHTKHLNHSRDFWQLVGLCCPDYTHHRRELRRFSPHRQARFI